jgi:hypothetical protein
MSRTLEPDSEKPNSNCNSGDSRYLGVRGMVLTPQSVSERSNSRDLFYGIDLLGKFQLGMRSEVLTEHRAPGTFYEKLNQLREGSR